MTAIACQSSLISHLYRRQDSYSRETFDLLVYAYICEFAVTQCNDSHIFILTAFSVLQLYCSNRAGQKVRGRFQLHVSVYRWRWTLFWNRQNASVRTEYVTKGEAEMAFYFTSRRSKSIIDLSWPLTLRHGHKSPFFLNQSVWTISDEVYEYFRILDDDKFVIYAGGLLLECCSWEDSVRR